MVFDGRRGASWAECDGTRYTAAHKDSPTLFPLCRLLVEAGHAEGSLRIFDERGVHCVTVQSIYRGATLMNSGLHIVPYVGEDAQRFKAAAIAAGVVFAEPVTVSSLPPEQATITLNVDGRSCRISPAYRAAFDAIMTSPWTKWPEVSVRTRRKLLDDGIVAVTTEGMPTFTAFGEMILNKLQDSGYMLNSVSDD